MSDLTDKVLIWLNDDLTQSDSNVQQTLDQLHPFIYQVHSFTSPDSCVNFLTDIDQQHVFLIISHSKTERIIPHIHPHRTPIRHIHCDRKFNSSLRNLDWKLAEYYRLTYSLTTSIYKDLSTAVKKQNQDLTPLSILSSFDVINNMNQDCLEPTFMYTKLFKETLLNMDHDKQFLKYLISFCQKRPNLAPYEITLIDEFEGDYSPDKAIYLVVYTWIICVPGPESIPEIFTSWYYCNDGIFSCWSTSTDRTIRWSTASCFRWKDNNCLP